MVLLCRGWIKSNFRGTSSGGAFRSRISCISSKRRLYPDGGSFGATGEFLGSFFGIHGIRRSDPSDDLWALDKMENSRSLAGFFTCIYFDADECLLVLAGDVSL